MHVNRSRFLALTATIAAGGCAPPPQEPPQRPATVVNPTEVVVDEQGPSPVMARDPEPGEEASGAPTQVGTGPHVGGAPTGVATACTQLKAPAGPHCESFHSLPEECEIVVGNLRPGISERAMSCLMNRSGTRKICRFGVAFQCGEEAIRSAPADPATASACRTATNRCKRYRRSTLTMANCQQFLSSLVNPNHPGAVNCMSESCDVAPCFFALD